jgi:DNA-binding CsgD family transcriptional regulator/tetratricopeptide (TPR) repeat protein
LRLLERQRQQERLDALLTDCIAGRGRVALVFGEAGVGKSALVDALTLRVADRARVLRGACEDLSIPDPLAPLYDLARNADWEIGPLSRDAPKLPLFSQALGVFESSAQPTILMIEDLHWADDATLDFVRFLGRRISRSRILLLLTSRDDTAAWQQRIRRALVDIPAETVARIEVPLLSEDAVAILATEAGRDRSPIYRLTGGNCFFVTELLRAPIDDDLPQTVKDAVLARAERLCPAARSALDAVSVFPRQAEAFALECMLGLAATSDLQECLSAGLLSSSGDGYSFCHEVARRAVEAALTMPMRRRLNQGALEALKRLPSVSAARLIHHALAARDVTVIREFALPAAEEAARLGGHREAVGHLRTALDFSDESEPAARAKLLELLAFENHLIGRLPEALAVIDEARRIHATLGNPLKVGSCLRLLSRFSYLSGNRETAEAYGSEAVHLLETQQPGADLAMAHSNLAQLAMLADRPETAVAIGWKAVARAEGLGRHDIVSHALNNIGTALGWTSAVEARQCLARSLEIALDENLEEHVARAYTNLACVEINLLDYQRAGEVLRVGIEYCIERDLDTWRDYMRGWQAELLLRTGHWDACAEMAGLVLDNDRAVPLARYPAGLALARLRLRRGDPLGDLFQQLARFLDRGRELQRLAPFATLMAERAWLGEADTPAALSLIEEAIAMMPNDTLYREIFTWKALLNGSDKVEFPKPKSLDAPYESGLSLLGGTQAERRAAFAIFTNLGACAVIERAGPVLRRSGISVPRGPYRDSRQNVAGHTRRQMDVLRLIGRGLSNKAIANSLAISPKTVDHHVTAVLEKLAVKSRGAATAAARNLDLI